MLLPLLPVSPPPLALPLGSRLAAPATAIGTVTGSGAGSDMATGAVGAGGGPAAACHVAYGVCCYYCYCC